MINRRIVRVKAFKVLYGAVSTDNFDIQKGQRELEHSIGKTLELYALMLLIPNALARIAQERLDIYSKMFHPSERDIRNAMLMRDNPVVKFVQNDKEFLSFCEKAGISWSQYHDEIKALYSEIIVGKEFEEYCAIESPVARETLSFYKQIYSRYIEDFTLLTDALEESSPWWVEDIGYVLNALLENINHYFAQGKIDLNSFAKENTMVHLNTEFGKQLISAVLSNYDEYAELAQSYFNNWEQGRIVFSDMLIIVMAVAEAFKFADIGLRVTLNEYLEIIKYYSTPKSTAFVNGVLNNLLRSLQDEGKITKSPRGMMGALTD